MCVADFMAVRPIVSLKTTNVNLMVELEDQSGDHHGHVVPIHPVDVEIIKRISENFEL